jgi:hypothetical protein
MQDVATIARENAISLEAKKDGLTQRQDGSWLLRLRVHPNDDVTAIAAAAMGTRFMVALVALADDDSPQQKKWPPVRMDLLAQRAAILCGEKEFQAFARMTFPMDWERAPPEADETDATAYVLRIQCGVRSRKEIVPHSAASVAFEDLLSKFETWRRGIE